MVVVGASGSRVGCRERANRTGWTVGLVATAAALLGTLAAVAQQVHRNGFENQTVAWQKGPADVPFREALHEATNQTAHNGQWSEHIQLTAETGNYIYYVYPTDRAPLNDEFAAGVWVKAKRPGTQLLARLVLPHEHTASNLSEPLTVMLRGDQYQSVGRWQGLKLRSPTKLAREQQQLVRAELNRDVDFSDAYVDQLILNVYGGPGLTELWVDDVEIGPVLEEKSAPPPLGSAGAPGTPGLTVSRPAADAAPKRGLVSVTPEHLMVNGKRFFFRAIRYSDTPLKTLQMAGFNTLCFDAASPTFSVTDAVNQGFWLAPALPLTATANGSLAPGDLERFVNHYPDGDGVLFWLLGGGLTAEQVPQVSRNADEVHAADPQRPLTADVWDGFRPYSRKLNLVAAHRWPLMTSLELPQYREWLTQRRQLAMPGTFFWTWVQTHLPDWYTALVYDRPANAAGAAPGFAEAVGPQPEQIRLMTYVALSAGAQGLGFWSDKYLADSHQGRDRLLTLALLNQELQLLEPLLLSVVEAPTWIDTSSPDVKAAVLRTERGILVLPIWLGAGSQYVPGQAAVTSLSMVVPQVPAASSAWELSPGDVHAMPTDRVPGGTRVTLPEFGLTAAVVFTADNSPNGLLVHFQDHVRQTRKLAAQYAYDLANEELKKVLKVEAELERAGHTPPDAAGLKDDASRRLKVSLDHWNAGNFREAYAEANRVLRPLRLLMRAQWEAAVRGLDGAAASPYALCYYTLPKHWEFIREVRAMTPLANVLTDGDFEAGPTQAMPGWQPQEATLDEVTVGAWRVEDEPHEGKRCLKLEIKPKAKDVPPPSALERTFLALNSPAAHLPPGSLVKISAWVRIPEAIKASVDGALFYDTAGGEPLAVRLTGTTKWRQFTLYRRVPESGTIGVTLALTGLGTVYFDDVKIEPLSPNAAPPKLPENTAARR